MLRDKIREFNILIIGILICWEFNNNFLKIWMSWLKYDIIMICIKRNIKNIFVEILKNVNILKIMFYRF